jgi:alkanesulfonate monooxygenase SsuD/methylene tetrahydromethanopterin reductase-like flavin-dependent oxidoreductase (luciferase family)
MLFGVTATNFGDYSDPRLVAELAYEAEDAGWDGFFIWDHITWPSQDPVADPWITLAAMAARTTRIRLGPMVAAMPRRRPWKVARETVTLDRLSGGRVTLGVGLGFHQREEFEALGEDADPKVRAAKLDEGLEVLTGLWTGKPFTFIGDRYQVRDVAFLPPPVQEPRIPIWVAGAWPVKAPFRRAARWDGVFPMSQDPFNKPLTPVDVRDVVRFVKEHRTRPDPFDVVRGGRTPGRNSREDADLVIPFAEAGVTWWLESPLRRTLAELRARIHQGPPRP